jgi:hypothetical protein
MKRYIVILAVLLFTRTYCSSQAVSDSTMKIADSFVKLNEMICKTRMNKELSEKETALYRAFSRLATLPELITLTDNENGVIRCFAFQFLASKPGFDIIGILRKHQADTAKVRVEGGANQGRKEVRTHFIEAISRNNYYKNRILDSRESATFDSILVFCPGIITPVKDGKLLSLPVEKKYYLRIREIALKEHNNTAFVALAKYHNPQDISLIKSLFNDDKMKYYAVWAVSEYPDSAFYPIIIRLFDREFPKYKFDFSFWRVMYEALVQYPDQKTYDRFEQTIALKFQLFKDVVEADLDAALDKYPNPFFDALRKKVKTDMGNSVTRSVPYNVPEMKH